MLLVCLHSLTTRSPISFCCSLLREKKLWGLTQCPFCVFFNCVSFHLFLLFLLLIVSFLNFLSSVLSLSFLLISPPLHLSLPLLSLLPLFRLCKVQLGFGAFGLQAWRQEDALSEYALLGSLCVTLYFFALLFYLYLLLFNFSPPYIRRVTVILSCGFSSLVEEDPLLLISSVLCRNLLNLQKKPRKVSWVDMNIKLCDFRSWNLSILVKQTSRNNVFTLKKVVGA